MPAVETRINPILQSRNEFTEISGFPFRPVLRQIDKQGSPQPRSYLELHPHTQSAAIANIESMFARKRRIWLHPEPGSG